MCWTKCLYVYPGHGASVVNILFLFFPVAFVVWISVNQRVLVKYNVRGVSVRWLESTT